jgi:hypothetical protein
MTYRQDSTERKCEICSQTIETDQWMLDLFRASPSEQVCWIHEACARKAVETWLKKKWLKTPASPQEQP